MITDFKIFENKNTETTIILNDLVAYYEDKVDLVMLPFIRDDIRDFFNEFLMNSMISFFCEECSGPGGYGWGVQVKHRNKTHKGVVRGYGTGVNTGDVPSTLHLSLNLNRIRHEHLVDTSKPITIYGDLPEDVLEIIDEVNMLSDSKKYNL